MKNLSKEDKEEIISITERINNISDDLKSVCKNNFRKFCSPSCECSFYKQFILEINDELIRICDIVDVEFYKPTRN